MRQALSAAGRDPSELRISGMLHPVLDDKGSIDLDETVRRAPALVEAGVTDIVLSPIGPQPLEHLRALVAALRAAVERSDLLP
jgi:hypothetical protein